MHTRVPAVHVDKLVRRVAYDSETLGIRHKRARRFKCAAAIIDDARVHKALAPTTCKQCFISKTEG
ncbi:hypothetical protein PLICRDRAFT_39952 [Plicaturopsis crispa FD-325 SS-3]|nr:hypothetical protein PLICRDRAFT_39952 [Plicaturopsis crispa FD-325 SS-3]